MTRIRDVVEFLERLAPPVLAAEWDNVGLLMGDHAGGVERIMTCLTITPDSAAEAIERSANLIVTHHPLPFRPLQRITADSISGKLLWDLARHGIAIYSPHTAFDSAAEGINFRLATGLGLNQIAPLVPGEENGGDGRYGTLAGRLSLEELAQTVKQFLRVDRVQIVGARDRTVHRVAVACGSAGELLPQAIALECDCLVTGEIRFHGSLEAESAGLALILAGHYASERFAVEEIAARLGNSFADVEVWASQRERDPLHWI